MADEKGKTWYGEIEATITDTIKENRKRDITAVKLQGVLLDIVELLKGKWLFGGVVQPSSQVDITGDVPTFYLAFTEGTYTNFGNNEVADGEFALFMSNLNGNWDVHKWGIGTLLDGKVDKENGYGLSQNDYTDADRDKVASLPDSVAGKSGDTFPEGNFASFDEDGNLQDSNCNEGTFIRDVQQNGVDLQKDPNGKVNVTVQDGEDGLSVFEIAQQQGYTGTVDQWLASLKANIGAFQFITPTDTTAEAKLTTIGSTYASAIGGVSPSQATLSIILLMNDSNNTKTMMIATQDDGNSGFEFVYAGDLQSAMPSNVLTQANIVNDLTTGGVDDVASAETVKTIAETTMELVESENLLNPADIDTEYRLNTSGALKAKGTYTQVYGVTDYIEIGNDGIICTHCTVVFGSSVVAACVYDSNKLFIGYTDVAANGDYRLITKDTTLRGTPAEDSDSTNPTYVRFSLYNPTYVEGGVAYDGVTDGYAVYKGTTRPQSFIPYVAPYWKQKDTVIQDGAITTAKIADSAVTIDKMADTVEIYNSKNLFDKDDPNCLVQNRNYISINTGNVSTGGSTTGGYTGYIPIDERGLYFNVAYNSGSAPGNAQYDENFTFIEGSGNRGQVIHYAEGAKWARITLPKDVDVTTFMVNAGQEAIPFEPYTGKKKVISPDILPDMGGSSEVKTYLEGVEVQLPNEIVVTKGDNLQVFYRSCVKCRNIEAFDVTANCKKGSTYYGIPHPRYFQLDTSSSSIAANNSYTLTITVSDNAHRVVASGSTTIRVINAMTSPSATKNILVLGASTLADGRITREVYRRLCTNSGAGTPFEPTGINLSNNAFVGSGSTGSTYPNVYQEAHSGKGWNWYADQGSDTNIYRLFCPSSVDLSNASEGDIYKQGTLTFELTNDISTQDNVFTAIVTGIGTVVATNGTLTKESGSGPDTINYDTASAEGGNPFWYGGKLDFQHYANDAANHCNVNIDLIVACLGGNDIAQVTEGFEYCKETYIKPFLDAFHADFPNGKVMIYTPPLLRYDGCAAKPSANYWPRVVQFWAYAQGYEDLLTEEYAEGHTYSEFVSVTATTYEFDNVNLFGGSDIPVCNRSEATEKFSTDNLHYGLAGCNTVADTLYHCINDIL